MHSSSGVPTSLATSSLAVTWSRGMQAVADEATALARLFGKHEWLTRCWLTSFCTDNIFSKLQPATQAALLSLSDEELQRLATDLPVRPEWPDELTELLNAARRIAPPATARRVPALVITLNPYAGWVRVTRSHWPVKRDKQLW